MNYVRERPLGGDFVLLTVEHCIQGGHRRGWRERLEVEARDLAAAHGVVDGGVVVVVERCNAAALGEEYAVLVVALNVHSSLFRVCGESVVSLW
eukprot:scaffold7264_cov75-Phaeocystis_antarctica.AAC.4